MFFGGSSFASSPFGDPGGVSIAFTVNGVRMNVAVGNVQIIGKAIKIGKTVIVTGEELALATNTIDVISWNPIIPGATGVWIPIDPDNP